VVVAYSSHAIPSPHGHHACFECRFLRMLVRDVEIIVTSFVLFFMSCAMYSIRIIYSSLKFVPFISPCLSRTDLSSSE